MNIPTKITKTTLIAKNTFQRYISRTNVTIINTYKYQRIIQERGKLSRKFSFLVALEFSFEVHIDCSQFYAEFQRLRPSLTGSLMRFIESSEPKGQLTSWCSLMGEGYIEIP